MQAVRSSNRIEHLDGLRGIAALIVVLGHYTGAFLPLLNSRFPLPAWVRKGFPVILDAEFCVFIFFVLSGFVLAESSAKTKSGIIPTVVARYLRLTVPMLVSLILAWFWVHQFRETRLDFQKIAQNDWLTNEFYTDQNPGILQAIKDGVYGVYTGSFSRFDGPVWTMRKELLGSISVYLLYLVCPIRFRWWALTIFGIGMLAGARFYFGFALGILLREMWLRGMIKSSAWGWLVLCLSLFCAWGLQMTFDNTNLLALAAAGVVFSVMTLPLLRNFLDWTIPQFLGRISFALYLVHLPLALSIIAWGYLHITCPMYIKFVLGLIVFLIVSVALAWIITFAVDEPLVEGLHWLKKHPLFGQERPIGTKK